MVCGGFTQASGDTGGAVDTGLNTVETFQLNGALSASDSSGTVTVTMADPGASQAGFWFAIGL